MEDTKQNETKLPQPLTPEQATSISGGADASCPTTVTISGNPSIVQTAPDPSSGLIAVYEGFVDVTSHIIERVANVTK